MSHCMSLNPNWRKLIGVGIFLALAIFLAGQAAGQFDGFTEPYRSIELASDETGLIENVLVEEGDSIRKGEEIARLSSDLQRVQ